jgi:hypothetical protein
VFFSRLAGRESGTKLFFEVKSMKIKVAIPGYRKTLVMFFLIVALLVSPLSALSEMEQQRTGAKENSAEMMAVDLIAARPIGLVATVGGALVFLVSWPFSALGGNSDEAWQTLVVSPAEYTFKRPLGEFEDAHDVFEY